MNRFANSQLSPPLLGDRYSLRGLIGEGGFGRVYEAWDERLSRKCAIKVTRDSQRSACLWREAKAASSLGGPHIVRVFDVGASDEGSPYLVMEFLEGVSIAEVLSSTGSIEIEQALSWTHQACVGLDEAHSAGVIHLDVKPSNLFLARDGRGRETVKLLDFGLARCTSSLQWSPVSGEILNASPAYVSPEQIRNQPVDARTDIWSLGVVLYRMLSGSYPFAHGGRTAMLASIATDPPLPLERLVPGVPQNLVTLIERCLAKSPRHRFQSVLELDEQISLVARELGARWVEPELPGAPQGVKDD